jgi:uncharacterized delta-60 repeat protein
MVQTDLASGSDDVANAIAIQADGKILVAGTSLAAGIPLSSFPATLPYSSVIVRYNPDGTLDTTFNGGMVSNNFGDLGGAGFSEINSIALQTDGRIVVAGSKFTSGNEEFALARYNPDGTLDYTFGTQFSLGPFSFGTGEVLTDFKFVSGSRFASANSLAIQSDGRIVAAGSFRGGAGHFGFALARYDADGTLDPDFQGDGKVVTSDPCVSVNGMAIQPDGKIVAAGQGGSSSSAFQLARYNPDGSLDSGFGIGGIVDTQFPSSTGYKPTAKLSWREIPGRQKAASILAWRVITPTGSWTKASALMDW